MIYKILYGQKHQRLTQLKHQQLIKLVDTLKDEFIADKDNQITDLKVQNDDLRKLLDQQQQLQLKTQQMLEEKTLLFREGSKKKVVADMDKLNLKTLQQNKKGLLITFR